MSQTTKDNLRNEYLRKYPNSILRRAASYKYNCHSYAWYSQSWGNDIWMESPSQYMKDPYYTQVSSSRAGARIYYVGKHTGIVEADGSRVTSKWGDGPLFSHSRQNCPYYHTSTGGITQIQYWIH